ncbi:carbohydrate sulfotransferase 4-like [Cimex lectularius]|uniref:Sulfotransferase domain-containing protein n=1 Tax=Cimex lectularius TaxID=79782 RepID=A0A8I6RP75_CIMLE|nr:carbohydrate sulfotransferase 4-like [Cimex lectularius]
MRYIQLRENSSAGKNKKLTASLVGVIVTLCLISFIYSQSFVTTLPTSSFAPIRRTIQSLSPISEVTDRTNVSADIEQVLEEQRAEIEKELKDYKFPNRKYNISAKPLDNLVPEKGGKPVRSIIIATWRSGSTFLGDILNSVPGNFYHYEPLLDHGIVQVRGPPLSTKSLTYIRKLLNCNYTGMNSYLEFGVDHVYLFSHNVRLWNKCATYPHICFHAPFLNKYCSLFPFQSMKLVRLRLNLIEELLQDPNLGIRVLLVVRDPRGTMQSRKHRDWCPGFPDCSDPALVCADMVSDYSAAVRFKKKYPNTFRVLRYEDFSINPYKGTEQLFKFFGLEFTHHVKKYLDTHTKINAGGVSSTYRNSSYAPFHWRTDLDHKEVLKIQKSCKTAMSIWGYVKANNISHQRKFNPILPNFDLKFIP